MKTFWHDKIWAVRHWKQRPISFTNIKTFLSDGSNEGQQTLWLKGPIWQDSGNRTPGSAFTSADKHEGSLTTFLHINDTWSKLGFDLVLIQNNQKCINEKCIFFVKKKKKRQNTFSGFLMWFGKENDLNVHFQSQHVFFFAVTCLKQHKNASRKCPENITLQKKHTKSNYAELQLRQEKGGQHF